MALEQSPSPLLAMADDRLGEVAVSLAVAELRWTPDVAPAVLDRIARDAVAYPEQFDRRAPMVLGRMVPPPSGRSAKRALGRLAVFALILVVIVALVLFAATVSGATDLVASVPTIGIDGTLDVHRIS
jgi:hypothetical protein